MTNYNCNTNNYQATASNFPSAHAKFRNPIPGWKDSLEKSLSPLVDRINNLINNIFSYFASLADSRSNPLTGKVKSFHPEDLFIEELHDYQTNQKDEQSNTDNAQPGFAYYNKEDTLESNLSLGKEILEDTKKAIPFSANYMSRNRQVIDERAAKHGIVLKDLTPIVNEAIRLLNQNRDFSTSEFNKVKGSQFTKVKIQAKKASSAHIGNCGEMAQVALFKGMEKGAWNVHLDKVYIQNGDHAFLVIGRKPGSDPKNYKTWGPTAVAVDAWAGKVFKFSEIDAKLNDYYGWDGVTGKPKLRPFNPNTQRIEIEVGNLCTVEELIDCKSKCNLTEPQLEIYDRTVQQLKKFQEAKNLQTKKKEAVDLASLCQNPSIRNLGIIGLLKDQIEHFIKLSSKHSSPQAA